MEAKLKHLEFIQAVINRMSSNSFLFKGWAITLAAGMFTLATSTSQQILVLAGVVTTCLFWAIDGYYLSIERRYRELFQKVADKNNEEVDFTMTLRDTGKHREWFVAVRSDLLVMFYGTLSLLQILTLFLVGD